MKMPNFSSRDMAIYDAADLAKALKTPRSDSPFQVGESQLKEIMEYNKKFDAEIQLSNRDALPTPPYSLIKQSSKLPRVKYQIPPPTRVDTEDEYKEKYQKHLIPNKETPLSATTRRKYTQEKRTVATKPLWPLHRK